MDIDEVVGLWHGDDATAGFAHAQLAAEICRLKNPGSPRALRDILYPPVAVGARYERPQLDAVIEQIVEDGYELWCQRGRPE